MTLFLAKMGKNANEDSVRTASHRLRGFLGGAAAITIARVTPARVAALYEVRSGKVATDTHRNELKLVRQFFTFCVKQGWRSDNPADDVEPVGRRRSRKSQLKIDHARLLLDASLDAFDRGDKAGLAVAMALLMGMRSGEVERLRVRDVDDGGRLLLIRKAKTEAGVRRLPVAAVLQDRLRALIAGRGELEPMWGKPVQRMWLYYQVERMVAAAGIEKTTPHGLRGLHGSLAMSAGATVEMVARTLGHAGTAVTLNHYITVEAADGARTDTAEDVLAGNKTGSKRSQRLATERN
jgi:integrase/recombinase XerD